MTFLISSVMYGGHVTDDWDRRLLMVYINDMICKGALTEGFKLSDAKEYVIQPHGDQQAYVDYITSLPNTDPPGAFGQHPNAEISSLISETTNLLGTLVSLQPVVASSGGESNESRVLNMANDFEQQVPKQIDVEATKKLLKDEPTPLNVVLFQEVERYNLLLVMIKAALIDLQKGIKGLVVMSADLEDAYTCLLGGIVPPGWKKVYPSEKPLAAWVRDLIDRVALFSEWSVNQRPPVIFWMSAFSFPTGFLTAVLQTTARRNQIAIDSLGWDFTVQTLDDINITEQPREGAFIRGMFIEGAGWDRKNACMVESPPMQLVTPMPTILFKPIEIIKVKTKKVSYQCPLYYYPNRNGEGGASAWSYVITVDLKTGECSPDHWIKRGAALLMSLAV